MSEKHPLFDFSFATRPHAVPAAVSSAMLLLALAPWPYGYYVLLRLVVCGSAILLVALAFFKGRGGLGWVFTFVALLFNPVIRVPLERQVWAPINMLVAVLFLVSIIVVRTEPKNGD